MIDTYRYNRRLLLLSLKSRLVARVVALTRSQQDIREVYAGDLETEALARAVRALINTENMLKELYRWNT